MKTILLARAGRSFIRLLSILCLSVVANANATLIDQGDTTFDSETGITWLDITETLGFSPDDFADDLGGYLSNGWRMASGLEVDTLLEHAGVPVSASGFSVLPNSDVTDLLLSLLGISSPIISGGAFGQAWAINSPGIYSAPSYSSEPAGYYVTEGSAATVFSPRRVRTIGVYLVREDVAAVPIGSTMLLMVAGLASLIFRQRSQALQS